jgi:FkbM family methyltransferase
MNRTLGALAERAARHGLPAVHSLGIKYIVKTLNSGLRVRLRTNDRLGHRLVVEERFEPEVRKTIRNAVKPGMTVLDIGANLGYYSLEMAWLVGPTGRVFAFEPQPLMVSELKANVEMNGLRNVTICAVALSNESGEAPFFLPVVGDEGMGSFQNNGRTTVSGVTTVPCSTLDGLQATLGIDTVDFIKMDVEGAELQVVEGALGIFAGPHQPAVVFEAHEANCAPFGYCVFDLLRRFDRMGYTLTQLDDSDWCAVPRAARHADATLEPLE